MLIIKKKLKYSHKKVKMGKNFCTIGLAMSEALSYIGPEAGNRSTGVY